MALMLYGNGIVDARGSVGGSTLSRSRAGATMRAKTSPTQAQTNYRQQSKALLSSVSGMWQSQLNATDRAGWNAFALITPKTNVFGQTNYKTGHQWFCNCNINLLKAGLPIITSAPASATVPGPLTLSLIADTAGLGSFELTYTDAGAPANPYINVFASPPISTGISYVRNLYRQIYINTNTGSPLEMNVFYSGKFPWWFSQVGKQVFALITYMDGDTGLMSPAIVASAIVT